MIDTLLAGLVARPPLRARAKPARTFAREPAPPCGTPARDLRAGGRG